MMVKTEHIVIVGLLITVVALSALYFTPAEEIEEWLIRFLV